MPKFEGTESRVFTVKASLEDTKAFMTDPSAFKALFQDMERSEQISDDTWRWVLQEKNEKGVKFKGDYTVKYTVDGDTMTWKTISDGNMSSNGRATFKAAGDGTRIDYTETIMCDMKVNRLLAKVIKPIVDREIAKGVGGYLDGCRARLNG